jgi:hypothetical protein
MKVLTTLLLLLTPLLRISGQGLPTGENGRVVFYEVVQTDPLPKEALYANAVKWLAEKLPSWQDETNGDTAAYRFTAAYEFPVYAKGYVSKQLHGTITCRLVLQIKDSRYRFYLSDFVFHYYHMDRTYKMVPTGKTKPLEDLKAPGWQNTWEGHREAAGKAANNLAAGLKASMKNKTPEEEKIAKSAAISEKW